MSAFNPSFSNPAEATKNKTGLFTCMESGCDQTYRSKQSLTRHFKLNHGQVAPQSGRFVCEVCDKRYKLAKELINHYKTHSEYRYHGYDNTVQQYLAWLANYRY